MQLRKTSCDEFQSIWAEAKRQKKHYIAVTQELQLTQEVTPISVYDHIRGSFGGSGAIIENVGPDGRADCYQYIFCKPFLRFAVKDGEVVVRMYDSVAYLAEEVQDPPARILALLAYYSPLRQEYQPPFVGGAVGRFGCGAVRFVEPSVPLANNVGHELTDVCLDFYHQLIVFDHEANIIHLVVAASVWGDDSQRQYDYARQELKHLARYLMAGGMEPSA